MPPRSGQLDEISQAIGGLQASVKGIETYIHDKQHEENGVAQQIIALGHRIAKDMTAVEGRIEGRIKAMDDRLVKLELDDAKQDGAHGVLLWILQSPLVGWIAAAILAFFAWWKKP